MTKVLNTDLTDVSDVTDEAKAWQEAANLPYPPTEFTLAFRKAVAGHESDVFLSLGYQWQDKPYRLVWALCRHIEEQAAILAGMAMPKEG